MYIPTTQLTQGGTPQFHGCRVFPSGAQSIADAGLISLDYASESFDTDGYHDLVTNNSRITIPAGLGGYYLIGGSVRFVAVAIPAGALFLRVNGTTYVAQSAFTSPAAEQAGAAASTLVSLVATDYFEVVIYQNSTGAQNTEVLNTVPNAWCQLVGV